MGIPLRRALRLVLSAALLAGAATSAPAADFIFNTIPFAGSTVLQTPGRQFVGNEISISNFDISTDRLVFDASAFGIGPGFSFISSLAADLPSAGATIISLQDIDADGKLANGVLNNAGLSANLIANSTVGAGPGFFLYYNSALNLNRLVFSPDLSSSTSDLKILARFTGQTGVGAGAALQQFSAANFVVSAVPEPTSWAMMLIGFGTIGYALRKRPTAGQASRTIN